MTDLPQAEPDFSLTRSLRRRGGDACRFYARRLLAAMAAVLLLHSAVAAGEDWTPATGFLVPRAVEAPEVDGDGSDLAWRDAASRLPAFAGAEDFPGEIRARAVCDAGRLYLLLEATRVAPGGTALERDGREICGHDNFVIYAGRDGVCDRRVIVDTAGNVRDECWDGWSWGGAWESRASAAAAGGASAAVEVALPRVGLAAGAERYGAGFTLEMAFREGERERARLRLAGPARLDLPAAPRAVRLGGEGKGFFLAATFLRVGDAGALAATDFAGRKLPQPGGVTAQASLDFSGFCQPQPLSAGETELRLPLGAAGKGQRRFLELRLRYAGGGEAVFPVALPLGGDAGGKLPAIPSGATERLRALLEEQREYLRVEYPESGAIIASDQAAPAEGLPQQARAAAANPACRRRYLETVSLLPPVKAESRGAALRRAAEWLDYRERLPRAETPEPALSPRTAGARLAALALMLESPERDGEEPALSARATRAYALDLALVRRELFLVGSDPRDAAFAAECLVGVGAEAGRLAERNLAVGLLPGNAPTLPGLPQLRLAALLSPEEARQCGALRELLLYLSAKSCYRGGVAEQLLGRGAGGETLAGLAALFPETPELGRFTPEGQIAAPVSRSSPPGRDPEYCGIYSLNHPAAALNLTVAAPPAARPGDLESAQLYGALEFATAEGVLLRTPGGGAMLVNGMPPNPFALPPRGEALPHTWLPGPVLDIFSCAWRVYPERNRSNAMRRTCVLVKLGAPTLYVCDAAAVGGRERGTLQRDFELTSYGETALVFGGDAKAVRTEKKNGQSLSLQFSEQFDGGLCSPLLFAFGKGKGVTVAAFSGGRCGLAEVEGEGKTAYLAESRDGGLEVGTEGFSVAGDADFAGAVYGAQGLEAVSGLRAKKLVLKRAEAWQLDFSQAADFILLRHADGSLAVTAWPESGGAVNLCFALRPAGAGAAQEAQVPLAAGQKTVFRLMGALDTPRQ